MTNTFEKYSKRIPEFFQTIVETKPDYIVPVERKGCKLLRSLDINHVELYSQIRYKQFFANTKPDIRGKRVAVIDDASKYTSTLFKYREYFESLGAIVDTYSFVGQIMLETAEREQYDKQAVIFQYLNESTYQEYIIQQSLELSKDDHSFDIDHFVFRTSLSKERYDQFLCHLDELGEIDYSNDIYTPGYINKLCLYNLTFPVPLPFEATDGVYTSILVKIRFAYNEKTESLAVVPLYLASWDTKATTDYNYITRDIPFELPYEINNKIDLEGMYMNIIYICNLCLLKSFLCKVSDFTEFKEYLFEEYDLLAYIGRERTDILKYSASSFLKDNSIPYSNSELMSIHSIMTVKDSPKFASVIGIMKELREEYERRRLAKGASIFTTGYFLSYDELFARYTGRANLMKWIDILCDRGVLIVRNVIKDGVYFRVCRSGEADYDHTENKSSLLLPIVINACGEKTNNGYQIKATLLNKILANLAYDYPTDNYDFHNFFTKPYLYGPFTYAKNQLNDEVEVSFYDAEKISKYCVYNEKEKKFFSIGQDRMSAKIDSCFSQDDEVPFTEITSYIDFLHTISKEFGKADSLNELVLCRDQDFYYRHVHFNIVTAYTNIQIAYRTDISSKAERYIRDAAKVANEATKKLEYNQKALFDRLKETVGSEIRFWSAYQRVFSSKVDFSDEFIKSLPKLRYIALLEQAVINLMLYRLVPNRQYLSKSVKISTEIDTCCAEYFEDIKKIYLAKTDEEYNRLYKVHISTLDVAINQLCKKLQENVRNLRRPNDSDYVLSNRRRDRNVAINKCIQYIKKYSLNEYVLLQFDFSGFRNTEGTKAINVIEQVQTITTGLVKNPDQGLYVYGLVGSNAFGTLLLADMEKAIQFAKKLRVVFSSPELGQIEFKFGCCFRKVSKYLHSDIVDAWKDAFDCCKPSVLQKSYNAGFVVSNDTYLLLNSKIRSDFMVLTVENPDSKNALHYIHSDFESSDLERIIRYDSDTDDNIRIGIITVLTPEFVAMQKMLIEPKTALFPKSKTGRKATGREYCVGRIHSLDGKEHRVALTQTLWQGNTSATSRAISLLERFPNLDVIIMTGIAGGIPSPDDKEKHVRLGDIVVAKKIVSYDFVSEKRKITELRGNDVPPSARLIEAQNHLEQNEFIGRKPWENYIKEISYRMNKKYERPSEDTDILYGLKKEVTPHPVDTSRNGSPRVFKEKIASANRLVKNPVKRDALKREHNVYAIEMEGSGVADATWEAGIGYYVVRGISDYCDNNKNDIWHNYAALVAAAYTRALIEKLPL